MLYRRVIPLGVIPLNEYMACPVNCTVKYIDDQRLRVSFRTNDRSQNPFAEDFRSNLILNDGITQDDLDNLLSYAAIYGDGVYKFATPLQQAYYVMQLSLCHNTYDAYRAVEASDVSIDNGHKFGCDLNPVPEIPDRVLQFLFDLPGSGSAWIDIAPMDDVDPVEFASLLMPEYRG